MKKPTAFEKQVKRRVTARDHPFFAVCPPGLTRFCKNEILAHGIDPEKLEITRGGIEFSARPDTCMNLNLTLGSPSRILMRIGQFKATGFHQFETGMAAIEWDLFLPKNTIPLFKVHTRKSALYHSDALAQRGKAVVLRHPGLQVSPHCSTNDTHIQTIYIRAEQDRFHISLDTSGDPLYRRGIKQTVTPAPLRETLAFAMLHWAGYKPGDCLLDPMCGCGTFSLEAAMIQSSIPTGYFRPFAFEPWPGFSRKTFAWQKKQAEKHFRSSPRPLIFASDTDDNALRAARENVSPALIAPLVHIEKQNFFDIRSGGSGNKGVIMLNPPYGKRLGRTADTASFYREIGKKLRSDFKGWRTGIILPGRKIYADLGLKLDLHPIFHGGLDLFAGTGRI